MLSELRPFSQGNAGEVDREMVRIYDRTGYPRIEIFTDATENLDLDALAEAVVSALNAGPDASGP